MRALLVALLIVPTLLSPPGKVDAQQLPIGIVTRLTGGATVERDGPSGPIPLKTKDTVLLRDRIVTAEDSLLQVLLGGKAVLTMRGASSVTSDEWAGASTLDITRGAVKLAVATERMRLGERIDVLTPNAVALVRGTIVVAEISQGAACDADPRGVVSQFTVLAGRIHVALRAARCTEPACRRFRGSSRPELQVARLDALS